MVMRVGFGWLQGVNGDAASEVKPLVYLRLWHGTKLAHKTSTLKALTLNRMNAPTIARQAIVQIDNARTCQTSTVLLKPYAPFKPTTTRNPLTPKVLHQRSLIKDPCENQGTLSLWAFSFLVLEPIRQNPEHRPQLGHQNLVLKGLLGFRVQG